MKIGDKFLCKKTNKGHDNDIGVEENIWYEVVKMSQIPTELSAFTNGSFSIPIFVQLNDGKSVFNISFCLNDYENKKSDYIWNYFYKTKELRKKKLENIIKRD